MGNGKNLIAQNLKRVKEKHHVTIEHWAKIASIPESTLARYLSSSLNIPNFPYVCALLKSLNEPIEPFYDSIVQKIEDPVDALKLDAVPTAIVGDVVVDMPETTADFKERILVQTEDLQAQKAIIREREATIDLLEAKLELLERLLEEKERTLESVEEISARRLRALHALCSAE